MFGKTSVTLTTDEIMQIKEAVNMEIESVKRFIGNVGDPSGCQSKRLATLEGAHKKLRRALHRSLK